SHSNLVSVTLAGVSTCRGLPWDPRRRRQKQLIGSSSLVVFWFRDLAVAIDRRPNSIEKYFKVHIFLSYTVSASVQVWVKWGERRQFIAQNKLGMTSCHKDLPQTFPGHPWLDTPEGHAALRR
ncbi:hypothetical protein S245_054755, partial [Arachis hypogaea]